MNRVIENFINGNVKEALNGAKYYSRSNLKSRMIALFGFSENRASVVASYLKGLASWQAACDAN